MKPKKKQPNPGSPAALSAGCLCPVLDNEHGAGFPYPGGKGPAFWVNAACPLHGTKEKKCTYAGC